MPDPRPPLSEYRRSVTSQWGEDGILEELFTRIGTRNRYCVELGAWDGKHLSNVWHLWQESGWSAVLIEGDEARYTALAASTAAMDAVQVVHAFATPAGASSLDALLVPLGVPRELDLLSIDIDGDDYHLLASLEQLHPRCIIIEFNPTIPPGLAMVQAVGRGPFGASARAILNLAHEKGYKLAAVTDTNLILVVKEAFDDLGYAEPDLADVFPSEHLTYLISGYDGAAYLSRRPIYGPSPKKLPFLGKFSKGRPHAEFTQDAEVLPVTIHRPSKRAGSRQSKFDA